MLQKHLSLSNIVLIHAIHNESYPWNKSQMMHAKHALFQSRILDNPRPPFDLGKQTWDHLTLAPETYVATPFHKKEQHILLMNYYRLLYLL